MENIMEWNHSLGLTYVCSYQTVMQSFLNFLKEIQEWLDNSFCHLIKIPLWHSSKHSEVHFLDRLELGIIPSTAFRLVLQFAE